MIGLAASMSKRRIRIRRTTELNLPYGKSVVASGGLIVGFMLVLALLTDSRSGEIRSPALVYLAHAGLATAIVAVFYVEFRLQNKGQPTGPRRPNPGSRVKRQGAEGISVSGKC